MQTKLLPVTTILKTAWNKVYGTKGSFMAALAICFLIAIVFGSIENMASSRVPVLADLLASVFEAIRILLEMGLIVMGLERAFNLPVSYKDVFIPFRFHLAWRLLALLLLQCLIGIVIFIPCAAAFYFQAQNNQNQTSFIALALGALGVLIAIYLSIRMIFSIGYVLRNKSNPIEAIKQSFHTTENNFWRILGLGLLKMLIFFACLLTLGIALIWTIPLFLIAYGESFKYLATDSQAV